MRVSGFAWAAVWAALATPGVLAGQMIGASAPPTGEWPAYHGGYAGTRYSPLEQISPENLDRLEIAWTWSSEGVATGREGSSQSTPILVDGILYFTTGRQRAVVAADPGTGETVWTWDMDEGERLSVAPRANSGRGVSYWSDGEDRRIFVVTPGFQLVALNARTGVPIAGFGTDGVVDLKLQLGVELDPETAPIGNSSPPLVFEDFVVVGPALAVGLRPPSMTNVPGRVLALDARTGALKWRFNTIPAPGEFGSATWEGESASYTGNAGAWAPMSLDAETGFLYVPVEAATGDYYGGHRLGDNLFSTTLLCIDIRTGQRVWHQQLIHHEVWDRDIPTAPILVDITVDGRPIQAVAQLTKQSFVYVYDRKSGAPVWPIVETPVPQTDVPGERTAPTQPIPSKPAPYDRQGVGVDDLIDFTPELRAAALEAVASLRFSELYTPPSRRDDPDGTVGVLHLPGTLGGSNWEHGAFDPESGRLFVGSQTSPTILALGADPDRSDMDYVMVGGRVPNVDGLPIIKPPYGRVTAIDLNSGEHAWMVANGETPENIRNHEALAGLDIPATGVASRSFLLATKTVLFMSPGSGGEPVIRALDKASGSTLWEMELPTRLTSQPMSYLHEGRQYVAFWIAAQGGGFRGRGGGGGDETPPPSRLVAIAVR